VSGESGRGFVRGALGVLATLGLLFACDSSSTANEDLEPQATGVFTLQKGTGIDFVHDRFMTPGKKFLPEVLGAGLGVLDFDGDGNLDLYLVQGAALPGHPQPVTKKNRLYRNEGDFRFTDVTDAAGVGDPGYGMGVTCPDFDNDGAPDLYVTNVGANVLYRNRGDGTFEDLSAGSPLASTEWSTAAGWADHDRDGDLDLYLAQYAVVDFDDYTVCRQNRQVSYCHPDTLVASADQLFRNDGDGQFTDITDAAQIRDDFGKGLAVVPFDHDGDGWIDWFVANDSNENFCWLNRGDGSYEEMADLLGLAVSGKGMSQACMGTAIGDVDGDLDFDLFAANFGKETNVLYLRVEEDFYEDRIYPSGTADTSYLFTGFGSELFDFDHDTDLDLVVVNGHILDIIEEIDSSQSFEQIPHFFVNRGDGTFEEKGPEMGPFFHEPQLGRGLAVADLDNDGDLDFVVNHNSGPPAILENRWESDHHWLGLELVGTRSPKQAIGARVTVSCGDRTQVEEIRATSSYLSWRDLRLNFGLGECPGPCDVEIRWPSGTVQKRQVAADRYHRVAEDS
jgi:hypothetical protein